MYNFRILVFCALSVWPCFFWREYDEEWCLELKASSCNCFVFYGGGIFTTCQAMLAPAKPTAIIGYDNEIANTTEDQVQEEFAKYLKKKESDLGLTLDFANEKQFTTEKKADFLFYLTYNSIAIKNEENFTRLKNTANCTVVINVTRKKKIEPDQITPIISTLKNTDGKDLLTAKYFIVQFAYADYTFWKDNKSTTDIKESDSNKAWEALVKKILLEKISNNQNISKLTETDLTNLLNFVTANNGDCILPAINVIKYYFEQKLNLPTEKKTQILNIKSALLANDTAKKEMLSTVTNVTVLPKEKSDQRYLLFLCNNLFDKGDDYKTATKNAYNILKETKIDDEKIKERLKLFKDNIEEPEETPMQKQINKFSAALAHLKDKLAALATNMKQVKDKL
ncbi:MAG: hypothetical protein ABH827_02225 [bacterium]